MVVAETQPLKANKDNKIENEKEIAIEVVGTNLVDIKELKKQTSTILEKITETDLFIFSLRDAFNNAFDTNANAILNDQDFSSKIRAES